MESNKLEDVVVDGSAAAHGFNNCGEIVVGENHVAGFFGDFRSGDTHRYANVGTSQGGGVVHAISGHCDNLTVASKCFDDSHLVLWGDAGAYRDCADPSRQFLVRHCVEIVAGNNLALNTQLSSDSTGRHCVIASDHLDVDSGAMT